VVIHRGLMQQHDHSLTTWWKLAQSLNNLSTCLSLVGNREEAMQTVKESVDLYRHLGARDLEPHRVESLHNFSYCLSKLGRREEALQVIQEAVVLRRTLLAAQPATFAPDLGTTPCTLIVMWAGYSHGLHCNFTGCSNPCYIVIFVAVAPGLFQSISEIPPASNILLGPSGLPGPCS
jgi:tetratricopeptide (TPR) repeat protein